MLGSKEELEEELYRERVRQALIRLLVWTVIALLLVGVGWWISTLFEPAHVAAARTTGEHYCQALAEEDVNRLRGLYVEPAHKFLFPETFPLLSKQVSLSRLICKVDAVGDLPGGMTVSLRLRFALQVSDQKLAGQTLYLKRNGQIVFDPIFFPHPELGDPLFLSFLRAPEPIARKSVEHTLTNRGVPLFGFDPLSLETEREAALAGVRRWWRSNYGAAAKSMPVVK